MSLTELAERARRLPPNKQRQVFAFIESRKGQGEDVAFQLSPVRNLWKDLGIDLPTEDIDEARRELWDRFPREDVL